LVFLLVCSQRRNGRFRLNIIPTFVSWSVHGGRGISVDGGTIIITGTLRGEGVVVIRGSD